MEWSTDYNTDEYSWANLDNNYCRNPAGLNRPFCLTQDGSQEECDVIPCNENVCWDRGPPNYGKRSPKKRFYYVGERVTYTCNEGYTLGAGYTREVRCTENGNWLYDKPICSIDYRRRLIEEVLEIYGAGLAPENTTITFNGSVEQVIDLKWWDNQLKWDPTYYGGIKTHNVLGSRIWTPSFTVKRNANRTVANSALQRLPRQPIKEDLDLAPTLEEVIKATDQQKSGKEAGVDGLPGSTEAQHCTPNSTNSLCAAGNRESFPRTSDTLLSSPFTRTKEKSKILARVLLNRLVPAVAEHHLPESQCGFRANRDLSKAFDTVSRKSLWMILERLGCPPKFLRMVIQLHEDQRATEYLGDEDGIYIKYRTDGSPFNLWRHQAHTKTLEQLIRELLFAYDAALVAHTEFAMQRVTSCFAEASELFGLEVSLKKTEVLHQPVPLRKYCPICIKIGEKPLKAVHQFTYLGSTITSDAKIDKEVDNRLAKANSALGRLHSRVWKSKHLKKDTKISVYKAVVLTTLLYGSESWVTYRHHLRLLERFHQRCLRSILNIHWSDYVTNVEVLERAGILSIEAMLLKIQLRWAGHVYRMEDHRLPKIVLYGELSTGQRNRGAPKKRFKDCLKKSLSSAAWRHTVHDSVSAFERRRKTALEEKRSKRKNRTVTAPTPDPSLTCSHCGRVCLADVTYRGLQQDVPVRVSSDGLVVWSVETLTTTVCDADPFFFPADTMECHICFSAHTAIKQTIQCQGQEDGYNECDTFSAEKTEGEWYRKDKMFAKDDREACFVLHLERAPLFHIATTVGPCIILVALMTITFIMPLDRGDRISYGVTILLSMVVSLVFVTDVLPVKGVLPFFATVIIICMGLMGLFLFFTLIIIVIHDREGSLSPTAKIIFLRYMSKMLLLGDLTANKQANDEEPGVINNAAIEVTNCAYEADDVQAGGEDGDGNERNEQPSTPTEDASGSSGLSELITAVREVGALTNAVVREVGVTNAEIRELTKAVKNEEEVSDYILLAKVLDRLCLVMYVITIATTVPVSMYLAK
ncbi:hypothetical protein Bbelb_314120 [Branchiostoma belcheri]|nr:hypothetical protein Bbelb_314120 [Branchiostoma belcheri]